MDLGNSYIPLHSEASFTYSCPEIIWFYCFKNDKLGAPTTFCDGKDLWNNLEISTKKFFLENPIKYDVEIDLMIKNKNKPDEKFFVEKVGVHDSYINWKKGKVNFKLTKFVVNINKDSNSIYFANHLLVGKKEPQLKKVSFSNNKNIPRKIIQDILKKSKEITNLYKWKENTLLMINNRRFMHGRLAFNKNSNREILNVQTLKSKF